MRRLVWIGIPRRRVRLLPVGWMGLLGIGIDLFSYAILGMGTFLFMVQFRDLGGSMLSLDTAIEVYFMNI